LIPNREQTVLPVKTSLNTKKMMDQTSIRLAIIATMAQSFDLPPSQPKEWRCVWWEEANSMTALPINSITV